MFDHKSRHIYFHASLWIFSIIFRANWRKVEFILALSYICSFSPKNNLFPDNDVKLYTFIIFRKQREEAALKREADIKAKEDASKAKQSATAKALGKK